MTIAIPLVTEAICSVPAILARDGVAAALGIAGAGIALILADESLRAHPKASSGCILAAVARYHCRDAVQGCSRVLQPTATAIPLVAEAVCCSVPTILAR